MGALNIPSAADVERLTRRVRSVSQRLEGIEDGVDRLGTKLAAAAAAAPASEGDIGARLEGVEQQLSALTRELASLRDALPGGATPVPSSQERLKVPDGA